MRLSRLVCASFCLLTLSAAPGWAQGVTQAVPQGVVTQGVTKGVEIGASATYFGMPKDSGSSSKKGGLLVGAFVTLPVLTGTFKLSLQPEIHYTQRRSKVTDRAGSSEVSVDYVAIPILLKLKLFGPVYVLEGPSFSFPASATKKFATGKRDIDAKSDVSIVIALGMPVSSRVDAQLRWDSGIKAIQKSLAAGEASLRNRAISFVAAVHF